MKKPVFFAILLIFLTSFTVSALENEGKGYYDFGRMAYDEKDYKEAERMFKKALGFDPENPVYAYLLGKTYMKMEQYQDAKIYMSNAWKTKPDIPGLKYDLAFVYYKLADYSWASALFKEVVKSDPSNPNAGYYAGLSLYKQKNYSEAVDYFIKAGKNKAKLKPTTSYYSGLCFLKDGKLSKAAEQFEYVKDNAPSASLRDNSIKLLSLIEKQKKALKPYNIYGKISYKYDDNVRLEPLDEDKYADEGDFLTQILLSGKYNVIQKKTYKAGAGLSYYRTWHNDLEKYDLIAGIGNFYFKYKLPPFTLGFSYSPSKYWVDDDAYMTRNQFKPDLMWKINDRVFSTIAYTLNFNEYSKGDDKDGSANEIMMNIYYSILDKKGRLSGGIGYEGNSADASNESYDQFKTKIDFTYKLPWEMNIKLSGKYYGKEYDGPHPSHNIQRDDDKYSAGISLSRNILYDWMNISLEYGYTKNNSNIDDYTYNRNTTTLSITGQY